MSDTSHLNRRQLLGGLLAGGAAATALPLLGAESAAAAPASAPGIRARLRGQARRRDQLLRGREPHCSFHFPIDVSETPCRRADSACELSPDKTDNTIFSFTSTGCFDGRAIPRILHDHSPDRHADRNRRQSLN
jgi:hypothetical protein